MPRETWKDFLSQTSEDVRLSRNERKCLQDLAEGQTPKQLRDMRKDLFAFVYNRIEGDTNRQLVEYLEDVLKALQPSREAEPAAPSTMFFPGEAGRDALLAFLRSARQSLDVCVFTITDDAIARALVDAHQRGVQVRVITDDEKSEDLGSDAERLENRGIPVRMDRSPSHMHNKFAIRDGNTLLNGSYNWTRSAYRHNRENLVIHPHPKLVADFQAEFERLWEAFA